MQLIITADDLGISPGVNTAIGSLADSKDLSHTSWIVNTNYFEDSYEKVVKRYKDLKIGLHLNLTYAYSISQYEEIPLLVDKNRKFKNNFIDLLRLNIVNNSEFSKQVKIEIEAQLNKALKYKNTLSHIDGHWHIQMIPSIYNAVLEMKIKYNIQRVRVVNENFISTLVTTSNLKIFYPQQIAKYLLMKYLKNINNNADYYLFSFLFSSELKPKYFKEIKFPVKYKIFEIMLHPGTTEIDKYIDVGNKIVNDYIKSKYRDIEYEICKILKHRIYKGYPDA